MSRSAAGRRLCIALSLFCVIFAACLFCYNGVPITDDEQLFAAAAINRVNSGAYSAGQLYGNERLSGQYYGIGPLHAAAGSLLYRLVRGTTLGGLQVMFLAAPFYLAVSAVMLYLLARRRGYGERASVAAALLYAFGTMHWVYSKTFLRETLATALLLLMWLCFDVMTGPGEKRMARLLAWPLFLLAWAGILFTKVILGMALIIFLLAFFITSEGQEMLRRGRRSMWLPYVLAATAGLLCLYTALAGHLPAYFTNRVSDELLLRTWERVTTISHAGFFTAVAGSLISPGKGFFLYNPVLLAGLFTPFFYRPRERGRLFIAWALLLGLAAAQALVYDDDWWSITWGTRHLLPAVPGFILLALPFLADALGGRSRLKKWLFVLLAGSSLLVQAAGVTIADPSYLASLYMNNNAPLPGDWVWQPQLAPLLGHWKLILCGSAWDFAFDRAMGQSPVEVALLLGSLCLAMLAGLVCLSILLRKANVRLRPVLFAAAVLCLLEVTLLPYALLRTYQNDARYHYERVDFRSSQAWLEARFASHDTMLLQSYLDPLWYYGMNFYRVPLEWYSLPAAREIYRGRQPEEELRGWLEVLADEHRRLWYVEDFEEGEIADSVVRHYFDERYPVIEEKTFSVSGQAVQTRVTLYDMDEK